VGVRFKRGDLCEAHRHDPQPARVMRHPPPFRGRDKDGTGKKTVRLSRCGNLPWGPAFLCRATKVPPLALSFAVEGSKRGSAAPGGGQADRVRSVFAFMSVPLMAPVRDGARLYCASHISEHCSERPVRPQGRGLGVSKHSGHQAFLNPVLVNFTKLRASALASAWHYFHRAGGTCALWLLREVRGI
jgi:hypothetical protein